MRPMKLISRIPSAFVRWLLITAMLSVMLSLAIVVWIYAGSTFYEQRDDHQRVQKKTMYLESVASEFSRRSQIASTDGRRSPNIVLILFDDLGYGDLGVYGSTAIRTPEMDALAATGVRLTNYYAPASVCSPSRAGLMTGRYPPRTLLTQVPMTPGGTLGAPLSWAPLYALQRASGAATRLPLEEIMLSEVLSAAGYATGMFGKWHLGAESPSLPLDRGFDTFHGLLSSNDQLPNPYYVDRAITEESPVDQSTLTKRYTEAAIDFIEAHRTEPFFLYMPHTFPHRPLHPSTANRGRSPAGPYGDVVEDLDRSVGAVIRTIERAGLKEETLILVTSDNGPWFQGSPGMHRGRKTDLFDGGFRVPFLAAWPGRLPSDQTRNHPAMGIDLLPTILGLLDLDPPSDRIIDGVDIMPLLKDGSAPEREALSFYWSNMLGGIRVGDYKLHVRRPLLVGYAPAPLMLQMPLGPMLFDLSRDPGESYDVGPLRPEIRARLSGLIESTRADDAANPRGFH